MLRSGNFWVGVFVGVLAVYGYNRWTAKKMAK